MTFLGSAVVYQVALDWLTIEVRAENRPSVERRDVGDDGQRLVARRRGRGGARMSIDAVTPDPTTSDHALVGESVERRLRRDDRRRGLPARPAGLPLHGPVLRRAAGDRARVQLRHPRRARAASSLSGWNLDSYRKLGEPIVRNVVVRSATLAGITTVICLLVGYPFAYFAATRSAAGAQPDARRGDDPVLDELPRAQLRLAIAAVEREVRSRRRPRRSGSVRPTCCSPGPPSCSG